MDIKVWVVRKQQAAWKQYLAGQRGEKKKVPSDNKFPNVIWIHIMNILMKPKRNLGSKQKHKIDKDVYWRLRTLS